MMYGWFNGWGLGGWIVMGLMMLVVWGGIAALIVLLLRDRNRWTGPASMPPDDPERILRQRFARGEIDEAEFKARIDALRHHR